MLIFCDFAPPRGGVQSIAMSALIRISSNNCLTVAQMGDRLATIDMGRKSEAVPLLGELDPHITQCGLGRDLPPYQLVSRSIQPFGHNTRAENWGICPFLGGSCVPLNTVWPGPRPDYIGYQEASRSIQLFGHNRHEPKTGLCSFFWGGGAGSPSSTMWPGPRPTSVPRGILIHPAVGPQ